MDRTRWLPGSATALGVVLVVDVLRVFLPSVITVFGQAADTPAGLLGAFALSWFLLPLAVPALARRVGTGPVVLAGAVGLGAARVALQFAGGGRPQLWLGACGVLAGLVWLTAVAVRGVGRRGAVLGLALSTVEHAALGTVDLAWRTGVVPAATVLAVVGVFVAGSGAGPRAVGAGPDGGRVWAVLLPALLLWGAIGGSPALASTGVSYLAGSGGVTSSAGIAGAAGTSAVKALVAVAVAVFVLAALSAARPAARWPAAVGLVLGTGLAVAGPPTALPAAVLLVAGGLGGCLAAAATGPTPTPARRGYALALGGIAMVVAAALHYSAYDVGYDNRPVFVLVAVGIAVVARPGGGPAPAPSGSAQDGPAQDRPARAGSARAGSAWRVAAGLGVLTLVVTAGGRWGPLERPAGGDSLRLVAYNVRMGTGLDGRFDPDRTAAVIAAERPDVVLLSEVDRGWWLNGGHDGLALLADRLGMAAWFAPAADALWGDALLTRLPVVRTRTERLPADGAPTGAQALGAVLRLGDREVAVISTHLQPPPGRDPVAQARAVAAMARGYGDRPVVLGGDLNTEPGDPAYRVLTDSGLVDAFAPARPVPTSTADDPRKQIDHVLVSPGITAGRVGAPRSIASDHLAVAVTLTFP